MHPTPRLRLVVEYWPLILWFHPNYDRYLIDCVQFTAVLKKHVVVSSATRKLDGAGGKAVWASRWTDINKLS